MPRRLLPCFHVLALGLLLVQPPAVGDPLHIDCSWQALLQHDWNVGARSGEDVLFTYGPLGFALSPTVLLADGIWTRMWLGWAFALATAIALAAPARQLPSAWRLTYRIALLALAPFLGPSALFVAIAALGIAVVLATPPSGDDPGPPAHAAALSWLRLAAAMVLFAVAGCAKFTYFALSVATVAAIASVALGVSRRGRALGVAGLFAGAFTLVWLLLGQRLGDLPAWLHGSIEIAAGYNESMTLDGDPAERTRGAAVLAFDAGLVAWLLLRRERPRLLAAENLRRWGAAAIALAGLLVTWKSGFVRHDTPHAATFFGYAAIVPFVLVAASAAQRRSPARTAVIAIAIVAAAWEFTAYGIWSAGIRSAIDRAGEALAPSASVERTRNAIHALQAAVPLPRLRALVGDEPVDLMGHQQGVLFWAGFAVRHRPVFQSYSAYTPHLQGRNAAFFAGASAPRFVLANVQSVDGHLPMSEDSGAWLQMLERYRPRMVERTLLLLQLQPGAQAVTRSVGVEQRIDWGQWLELPTSVDWREASLAIEYTAFGRLLSVCYRPGRVFLDVRPDAGPEHTFLVGRGLVRSGFLLDPLIRSNADLLAALVGGSPPRVRAIRLRIEPGSEAQYCEGIGVRFASRPGADAGLDAQLREELRGALPELTYPGFESLPFAVEPVAGVVPLENEPRNGVRAPAPCRLLFRWPGGRGHLAAAFELLPDARVESDQSAVFRVEVGPSRRMVFERTLRPATTAADRGQQILDLDLDLPDGEVVALATDAAPSGVPSAWPAWRMVGIHPQ